MFTKCTNNRLWLSVRYKLKRFNTFGQAWITTVGISLTHDSRSLDNVLFRRRKKKYSAVTRFNKILYIFFVWYTNMTKSLRNRETKRLRFRVYVRTSFFCTIIIINYNLWRVANTVKRRRRVARPRVSIGRMPAIYYLFIYKLKINSFLREPRPTVGYCENRETRNFH